MALKIRLRRMGRKKAPHYRIVIAESSMPRDGRFVATIGHYNPTTTPETLKVDRDKAVAWIAKGAVPTDTVRSLFRKAGVNNPESTLEAVTATVTNAASTAGKAVKGVAGKVAAAAASAASAVAGVASDAAGTVASVASDAAGTVASAASDAASTVASAASDAASTVAGVASDAASTVAGAASSAVEAVKDAAGSVADRVTGGDEAESAPAAEATDTSVNSQVTDDVAETPAAPAEETTNS